MPTLAVKLFIMNTHFKTVTDSLIKEGFSELTEKVDQQGKTLDFNITPYSLNTKLSFKFDNLDHFIEFLNFHNSGDVHDKAAVLQATLMELNLDPKEFFYVNFFEKIDVEEV